jgi:hypothetical protein
MPITLMFLRRTHIQAFDIDLTVAAVAGIGAVGGCSLTTDQ